RARRGRREDQPDVHAVRNGRARAVPRGEGRVRSAGSPQPGQGGAYAASLCRVREDARARRAGPASRPAEVLMMSATAGDRLHPASSGRLSPTYRAALDAMRAIQPRLAIIADDEGLKPFETDALIAHRETPMLAVLPKTEAQVRDVVRACRKLGVPVVTRGAGTGISGGAIPHRDGVLLVLSKMNEVLEIDTVGRIAVVEPGVRNLYVSECVAADGLFYAPDPSSQSICSIGGNVAENSGGVHCLKYGLTTHNLLAVRAIDADGDAIVAGSRALDAPGYDLLAILTGSEGNLGVITQATVRLLPLPERTETLLAA